MPLNKQYKDFTQDFSPGVKLDNNGVFIIVKRLIPSHNCQFLCTGDVVTTLYCYLFHDLLPVTVILFRITA